MPVELIGYKHGRLLYLENDRYLSRFLGEHGEYCESEVELFRQILRPGDIAIDAGAHIGCHTIPMARMVGPTGQILAFEPQLKIYHLLCGNLALNGIDNVTASCMALGEAQGSIAVPVLDYEHEGSNFGGVKLGEGKHPGIQTRPVPLLAIDAMNLAALRLIKADVEGMELAVLRGAKETISRCRPFLFVENDRPELSEALLGAMMDMGYRLYWFLSPYVAAERTLVASNVFGVPKEMSCAVEALREITDPQDYPPNIVRETIDG